MRIKNRAAAVWGALVSVAVTALLVAAYSVCETQFERVVVALFAVVIVTVQAGFALLTSFVLFFGSEEAKAAAVEGAAPTLLAWVLTLVGAVVAFVLLVAAILDPAGAWLASLVGVQTVVTGGSR